MADTESSLRALDGLPLTATEKTREAVTLPALVRGGLAVTAAVEMRAERETGVANDQGWITLDDEVRHLMASGRFPRLAAIHRGA